MRKELISSLRQKIYERSVEPPGIPESKEAIEDDWAHVNSTGTDGKELPLAK